MKRVVGEQRRLERAERKNVSRSKDKTQKESEQEGRRASEHAMVYWCVDALGRACVSASVR
eukprot:2903721-Pleurochrysis_carterae.AAC.4